MRKVEESFGKGKPIHVGIDVHKRDWVVSIVCQSEELYHAAIPSDTEGLIKLLRRFEASEVHTVYEYGTVVHFLGCI